MPYLQIAACEQVLKVLHCLQKIPHSRVVSAQEVQQSKGSATLGPRCIRNRIILAHDQQCLTQRFGDRIVHSQLQDQQRRQLGSPALFRSLASLQTPLHHVLDRHFTVLDKVRHVAVLQDLAHGLQGVAPCRHRLLRGILQRLSEFLLESLLGAHLVHVVVVAVLGRTVALRGCGHDAHVVAHRGVVIGCLGGASVAGS